jgi:hypothetical protein
VPRPRPRRWRRAPCYFTGRTRHSAQAGALRGGDTRPLLALGLALVAVGCFLALDPAERATRLSELVGRSWPLLAGAVAGLLVLRAVPGRTARVLVVLLGAVAAAGLGAFHGFNPAGLVGAAPVVGAALGLLVVMRTAPTAPGRVTAVLCGRGVRLAAGPMPHRAVVSSVLASVHLDARDVVLAGGETILVRLLLSDLVLVVPAGWSIRLRPGTLTGVAVRDRGLVRAGGPELVLEVSGVLAGLTVDRR